MKTMSESAERLGDLLGVLLGRALADRRVAAGAEAAGDLVADADLVRRVRLEQGLGVRVAGDELDAHHLGPDHPVDGVAAAAADTDDANQREVLGVGPQRHRLSSGGYPGWFRMLRTRSCGGGDAPAEYRRALRTVREYSAQVPRKEHGSSISDTLHWEILDHGAAPAPTCRHTSAASAVAAIRRYRGRRRLGSPAGSIDSPGTVRVPRRVVRVRVEQADRLPRSRASWGSRPRIASDRPAAVSDGGAATSAGRGRAPCPGVLPMAMANVRRLSRPATGQQCSRVRSTRAGTRARESCAVARRCRPTTSTTASGPSC